MRNKKEQKWRDLKNLLWSASDTRDAFTLNRQPDSGITIFAWNNTIITNLSDYFSEYQLKIYYYSLKYKNHPMHKLISAVEVGIELGLSIWEFNTFSEEVWLERRLNLLPEQQRRGETRDNKDRLVTNQHSCSNRNKIRFPRKVRKTAWKRFYKLFPHLVK